MDIKRFTNVMGVVFLLVGILGFVPGLNVREGLVDPTTTGLLFGLFPLNAVLCLVHIAFGIWAMAAARFIESARTFNAVTAVVYGVFAVFGLIPSLRNLFGIMPLWGHDVWLHGLIALASAYFAWGWQVTTTRPLGPQP